MPKLPRSGAAYKTRIYTPNRPPVYATSAAATPAVDPFSRLTALAFVLLVALVACRAALLETVRDAWPVVPGSDSLPGGPGAATGLWLDLACAVPALLVLARRCFDKTYVLRRSWPAALFLALGGLAVASTLWAGDRFAAIVSGMHLLAAGAVLWAAVQLVRSWARLRVVTGILVGMLLVNLAAGYYYRLVELPDLRANFERNKTEILREQGWAPDSFSAKQFEHKITAGEMFGFTSSANSYAAVLVMLSTLAAGATIQRVADRDRWGWAATLVACLLCVVPLLSLTDSKAGALGTPALAAALLAGAYVFRPALSRGRPALYWAGFAAAVLALAAIVGHGLYHRSLPTPSLNFRWRYWSAAAHLIRDHVWLGVGWDNFGASYLAYRWPAAGEEVKDPHNYLVRATAELGVAGGALMLLFVARLAWDLTRPRSPGSTTSGVASSGAPADRARNDTVAAPPTAGAPRPGHTLATLGWIVAIAWTLNALCAIDFTRGAAFASLEVLRRLLFACATLIGAAVVCLNSVESPELDDRPAPWLLVSAVVAITVFLVHNLIEFSLFEVDTLTAFALLAGAALGARAASSAGQKRKTRAAIAATVGATLAWSAVAGLLALPTSLAAGARSAADDALRGASDGEGNLDASRFAAAAVGYADAYARQPLDAQPLYMAGQTRVLQKQYSDAAAAHGRRPAPPPAGWDVFAANALDGAVRADPVSVPFRLARARLAVMLRDGRAALEQFAAVMALNPIDVDLRLEYAAALQSFGRPAEARAQRGKAVWYNDHLDPAEPKRKSPEEIARIEAMGEDSTKP